MSHENSKEICITQNSTFMYETYSVYHCSEVTIRYQLPVSETWLHCLTQPISSPNVPRFNLIFHINNHFKFSNIRHVSMDDEALILIKVFLYNMSIMGLMDRTIVCCTLRNLYSSCPTYDPFNDPFSSLGIDDWG